MLRLWTFIPYRQRNMREMQRHTNLLQDEGIWKIRFVGEQLKVAKKQGQVNHFELPFPPDLVPALETYLTTWRPILSAASHHQFSNVFLTRFGTPYSRQTLHLTTARTVYVHTGKRWHPHIVRTVWATEWIRETHGDFYTAAIMLNDKFETVVRNYAHLLEEDVATKAYRLIQERHEAARQSSSAGR
jgi:site-specific recombinase XerD